MIRKKRIEMKENTNEDEIPLSDLIEPNQEVNYTVIFRYNIL